MPYKVNVKGREDGLGYDLVYGKGKAKLTAFAEKQPCGKFLCPAIGVESPVMLREVKSAAAAWFTANYTGEVTGESLGDTVTDPANTAVVRVAAAPASPPYLGFVPGARDPVCEGERRFFETLSTLTRRLTDKEARELRDITNYLTGIYQPVKIEENQDDTSLGTDGEAGTPVAVSRPTSGPPPYRPSGATAGPPPYRKPVGG